MNKYGKAISGLVTAMLLLSACGAGAPAPEGMESEGVSQVQESQMPEAAEEKATSEAPKEELTSEASEEEATSEASEEEPEHPSQEEASGVTNEITGRVVPLGDPQFLSAAEAHVGTQEELEDWYRLIASAPEEVVSILACNMSQAEAVLTGEQVNAILEDLANGELSVYEEAGNPPTGGAVVVMALDSRGDALWQVSFNGAWFVVEQEGSAAIFNGEANEWNGLNAIP